MINKEETKRMLYEVEARVYFENQEEVFNKLPFLKDCLKKKSEWETRIYGAEVYSSGRMLRVSESTKMKETRTFLGYKEADIGKVFNVRNEIDEEITKEIEESFILKKLEGFKGAVSKENIKSLLESFGHKRVITFTGINLTGFEENLKIDFKLMECGILKYPLILEIEKSAKTIEEAYQREKEIMSFIEEYGLVDRIAKEEPPSLIRDEFREGLF